MKPAITLLTFLIMLISADFLKAQEKQKKDDLKKERNFHGNRFRIFNNYVNFGTGVGRPLEQNRLYMPTALEFNFHIKKYYFMAGYQRSDIEGFLNIRKSRVLNDLHLTYGFRRETKLFNVAYYGGVTRVWGTLNDSTGFADFGLFAEYQMIRKLFYDVGAGLTVFGQYNRTFSMFGVRVDIFLSSAYQGRINQD